MTLESSSASRIEPVVLPTDLLGADADAFRRAMGAFPSPVAVVTALDAGGLPRGLTCSAVCSVSMAPPLLLVCVNQRSGSLDAIRESGGFVVNLLREGRHAVSEIFASPSPHKFAAVEWLPAAGSGLPLLVNDITAFVDCGLHAEIIAGTHAILIGSVRLSGRPDGNGPLVYHDRAYGRWTPYETPGRGTG